MKILKAVYEKATGRSAPYYYEYSLLKIIGKPIRKFAAQVLAPNCPFNCLRVLLYRLCGFKIGKHTFIGMKCYLDDMCYDLLKIGNHVTISYGVYFACHGKGQEHLPIVVDDGVYIGMRANVISKNAKNPGGGYIYTLAPLLAHALWSIRMCRNGQQRSAFPAGFFPLQTVQV